MGFSIIQLSPSGSSGGFFVVVYSFCVGEPSLALTELQESIANANLECP